MAELANPNYWMTIIQIHLHFSPTNEKIHIGHESIKEILMNDSVNRPLVTRVFGNYVGVPGRACTITAKKIYNVPSDH